MTKVRRSGFLLLAMAAVALEAVGVGITAKIASPRLDTLVPGRWLDKSGHEPSFALCQTALLLATLLPALFWKNLRDVGTLRLCWSWTVLLILPSALLNLAFFCGWPAIHDAWPRGLCIVWAGLATGGAEEWLFRGYMFHDHPEEHPRFLICISSLLFGLTHLLNLWGSPLPNVLVEVLVAFVLGLGFGIVRLASGSLGWCILVHGMIDASFYFAIQSARYHVLSAIHLLIVCLVTPVILWRHPALRPVLGAAPGDKAPDQALQRTEVGGEVSCPAPPAEVSPAAAAGLQGFQRRTYRWIAPRNDIYENFR